MASTVIADKIPLRRWMRVLWNKLTSMQLALALLFLLAVAAIPGALLPQHQLNEFKTQKYISDHGFLGKFMDRVQLFSVFSSTWFTAIYVLLCASLIGCIIPRAFMHYRLWKMQPPRAPRNLVRLPYYHVTHINGDVQQIGADIISRLGRWRKVHTTTNTAIEIAAEKGFIREIGNIIFHSALVGLFVCIAIGKLYSYEGIRIITAGNNEGICTSTPASFDSFRAGRMVDGTDLTPICIQVDDFSAHYLDNGQADKFSSHIRYTDPDVQWKRYLLQVNHPLRTQGSRVYLLGHGFSPTITVTFNNQQKRTQTVPFRPVDRIFFLSEGAMRFSPPGGTYSSEIIQRAHQIAIEGLFAPTAAWDGTLLGSGFPAPNAPEIAIDIYQGDTGLNSGLALSPYELDRRLIRSGKLVKQQRVSLALGKSTTLPSGVQVTFSGYKQWIAVQVSHDPTQGWVLLCAVLIICGLIVSLTIKHRRLWFRIPLNNPDYIVECAGLTKTDQAGWGDNFTEIAEKIVTGKYHNTSIINHGHRS